MLKFIVIVAFAAMVSAKPGLLTTHSVVSPVVIGHSIHSAPSAVSHQSHTQYHSKTIVTPVLAPVVKSYVAAPVLHAAPVVHAAPVLSHVHHSLPVLKTVHAAPIVHSAQVLHSVPLVHSVHASPLSYGLHH